MTFIKALNCLYSINRVKELDSNRRFQMEPRDNTKQRVYRKYGL